MKNIYLVNGENELYIRPVENNENFYYSIYKNNHFIGIIKGNFKLNKKSVWIRLLLIERHNRKRGVGSIILKFIEKTFSDRCLDYMYISVKKENLIGLKFWIKNGFKKIKIKGNHDQDIINKDYIILFKDIRNNADS